MLPGQSAIRNQMMSKTEIIVPASTSNLGASFDTCGLALSLHLRIEVEPQDRRFEIIASGEGAEKLPLDESNLIVRAALHAASQRRRKIPGARLRVDSQIPLSRGLGSSSAAIIAGISIYEALSGERLSEEEFFDYALHFEGHGDNLAPSMLGGLVVAVVREYVDYYGAERRSLVAVKRDWPEEVRIVLCVPEVEMETVKMRAVLPQMVTRHDAIYNLQRAALLQAALSERRFDLINEALRDRLHQPLRAPLAPGLSEVLKLNDETDEHPGLLGVAISGAGSALIAFATGNSDAVAEEMNARMAACGVKARAIEVKVDNCGRLIN
ncbi:MAG: homoserine kinase, partial [Acidobacteria bacterium]|nr:homoserine kinase [Acidobacteriota bacterium]